MTLFAVRGEVLRAIRADPVWFEKACYCWSLEELQQVIVDFGIAKDFKVAFVGETERIVAA